MKENLNIFLAFSILVVFPCLIVLDKFAIISLVYVVTLITLMSIILSLPVRLILNTFFVYCTLSILLYILHVNTLPNWFGLTGPYGGIGTDDSRYFAAITDNLKLVPWGARDYIDGNIGFQIF